MTTRSSIATRFTSRKPRTIRQTPALEQLECRELLSNVVTPFDSQHALGDVRGTESVIGSAMRERMSRPTGFIRSAEAIDGNTIRVDFDKKISRDVAARLDF